MMASNYNAEFSHGTKLLNSKDYLEELAVLIHYVCPPIILLMSDSVTIHQACIAQRVVDAYDEVDYAQRRY